MKVYILIDNKDNIVAISEDKSDIARFYFQLELKEKDYTIRKITDKKKGNKYLNKYLDYYLFEYYGYIVRDKDIKCLNILVEELIEMIDTTTKHLKFMESTFTMNIKMRERIYQCIKDVNSFKMNKKDNDPMNIGRLIRDYYSMPEFSETIDRYYMSINK